MSRNKNRIASCAVCLLLRHMVSHDRPFLYTSICHLSEIALESLFEFLVAKQLIFSRINLAVSSRASNVFNKNIMSSDSNFIRK